MKGLYSIYDRKAQAYTQTSLFLFDNDGLAIRTVKMAAQAKQFGELIDRYPEDFELWRLGVFDNVSGDLSIDKQCICNFADFKEATENA